MHTLGVFNRINTVCGHLCQSLASFCTKKPPGFLCVLLNTCNVVVSAQRVCSQKYIQPIFAILILSFIFHRLLVLWASILSSPSCKGEMCNRMLSLLLLYFTIRVTVAPKPTL